MLLDNQNLSIQSQRDAITRAHVSMIDLCSEQTLQHEQVLNLSSLNLERTDDATERLLGET
jgi:hypothetical protein